jgi:hypothetical protein
MDLMSSLQPKGRYIMNWKQVTTAVSCTAVVGLLAACSSDPLTEGLSPQDTQRAAVVEQQVDNIPDWVKELPESEEAFYSVGTAVSSDLQLSIDKSTLAAKRTLADRIGGELSTQIKSFVTELGEQGTSDVIMLEIEQATKNVVANINVAGYNPTKVEIIPEATVFRTYVLLEYPVGSANDILIEQVRKNRALYARIRASKAFRELENSVNEKRERDLEDMENEIKALDGAE